MSSRFQSLHFRHLIYNISGIPKRGQWGSHFHYPIKPTVSKTILSFSPGFLYLWSAPENITSFMWFFTAYAAVSFFSFHACSLTWLVYFVFNIYGLISLFIPHLFSRGLLLHNHLFPDKPYPKSDPDNSSQHRNSPFHQHQRPMW